MAVTTDISHTVVQRQSQPDNDFIFPVPSGEDGPNNAVFPIGSTLELKWTTTLTKYDLILYQILPLTLEACPDLETNGPCVRGEYYIASKSPRNSHIRSKIQV